MDISGNSTNNTHNGNTLIIGDLTVQGNIFDEGGSEGIPDVERTNHSGLIAYAGTNPATGGVDFITDQKYILKKHGNWRIMAGRVDLTLIINGFNYFSLSFDTPAGDTIPTTTSVYLNGGMSSNVGGNSPNFIAQSSQVISGKVVIGFITSDKALWPQSQAVATTVKYSISYLTTQSDPNMEVLEQVPSYVQNPMVEQLNANNYNIINVGNIQANTFNGGFILTNPLTVDLSLSNNNINNINNVNATTLNGTTTNTTNIFVDNIATITASDVSLSNNIDMKNLNIKNVSNTQTTSINTNDISAITPATTININNDMDMKGHDIKDVVNTTTTNIFTNSISTIAPTTQLNVNNEVNFTNKNILNINDVQTNNTLTNAIYPRTPAQPIQIYEDTVYNEKSIFQLAGIINAGLDLTINTGTVNFSDSKILEPGLIQKTGTLTFDSASSYNFLNYVDFTTKRLNTIKFIRSEADFQTPTNLSGIYVIIGDVTVTQQLNITGLISIYGYNSLSKIIFNIPTLGVTDFCMNNLGNTAQNLYIQDLEFSKISSQGIGVLRCSDNFDQRTCRISNVLFKDCDARYALRVTGWKVAEILNNTFMNITNGVASAMVGIENCNYTLVESNEFIENVFNSPCISVLGGCVYIHINNNMIITNGASSVGLQVNNSAVIERIIITDNIFNAINGALPSNLLILDTTIHKGAVCNDNTNVDPCNAALEGLVNGNVVYTATVLNTWVPVDLTGFTVGTISRFVPTLNPYEFSYDGKDPIRCLINVNCQADHSTGGIDTVQLGLSQNGTVNVFVQAELSSGQASQVAITTVVTANFGDTFQIVAKNITAGSNANGFRAQSLNASLVEV